MRKNIKAVHSSKNLEHDGIPPKFEEEIEQMLLLLQMLPDAPNGTKSNKKRWTFAESVEEFIVFSEVIQLTD